MKLVDYVISDIDANEFTPSVPYGIGTTIHHRGKIYQSLIKDNLGNDPETSPYWNELI